MARYCRRRDIRNEGFAPEQVSTARLNELIELASSYIETVTERFFEPRAQTITEDGTGSCRLLLGEPIIDIESVEILGQDSVPASGAIDPAEYRVYNRHLTQGLLKPDDRDNPQIVLIGSEFHRGAQNIRIVGLFGYTEPDESATGRTPLLIREVCKKLVVREIPLLSETSDREDGKNRYRLIQEKTRDQSYTLDKLRITGSLTGDPEIDNVLIQFKIQ